MTGLLAYHITLCHIAQIVIDDIEQFVFGGFITTEPFVEEISDISACHGIISRRGPEWDEPVGVIRMSSSRKRLRIILPNFTISN